MAAILSRPQCVNFSVSTEPADGLAASGTKPSVDRAVCTSMGALARVYHNFWKLGDSTILRIQPRMIDGICCSGGHNWDYFNGALSFKQVTAIYSKVGYRRLDLLACNLNTLRPRQDGRYFADDVLKCIFLNENMWISLKIPLKFVPRGPINNILALVQIMAWCRPGDKPLSEPMLAFVPTHIGLCDTRPQWVNLNFGNLIIWHLCGNFDSRHQGVSPCLDYWNVLMFVARLTSRYLWKRRVLRYNQYLFITGSCSFFPRQVDGFKVMRCLAVNLENMT